ncbi:type III-B CRISPR module RAMP protein Cmr6 [Clostridium botulinum]|uniref:type III-B CRISPR module RAMP protein Cmr6 n=1 Tax=Clostridium botulinum TaxID=1491 RepID=UPI000C78D7DA|nr:type III-B CRISPR module RAMP protein Cmr6 [Clostridium botulinum]AUM88161.1 type III-B CRISPR module RAMP protein Cmr6 [Clostridium botulinum]NFO68707.1 type III-B CRISPR module RAMP protein Cmr6 [Clostridium botulinum]
MEVRIVKNQENKNGKNFVCFIEGKCLENNKKYLQYTKDDIAFVEKDDDGNLKIKEYHAYEKLMEYLDEWNKKERDQINKSLLINKFTNIFNLDKEYDLNDNENNILDNKIKRYKDLIRKSLENRFEWLRFQGDINDKLIIGLGNQSVFETDITLHNTYGIPYIPGSALKGVFRNYIIQEYFKYCSDKCYEGCNKECEKNANKDSLFIKIFGGENDKGENVQGKVIFMDSFSDNYSIKRDIMTPHHKDYYSSKEEQIFLPLDSDEPTPIQFLVMKKKGATELKFEINLAIDKSISNDIIQENESINNAILEKYKNKTIYEFILENLIDALNFHGLGAKTSLGYGYFNICKDDVIKKLERERQNKIDEEKNKEKIKKIKEQKRLEQEAKERKFKEDTKDMNELEIEIYKINQIIDKNKKNRCVMKFYNNNIDKLEGDKRKQLAIYMKEYLENIGKWKIKKHKDSKKKDKGIERVEKICEILNIDLP